MQRPDERKRQLIVSAAARLFATRPYHKVRLEDVASAAGVGKGTLYVYFDDKEDLYFSLIYEAFAALVDRLREGAAPPADDAPRSGGNNTKLVIGRSPNGKSAAPVAPARRRLRQIVAGLVGFAFAHPHFFELMRSAVTVKGHSEAAWQQKRAELAGVLTETIRRGVRDGELSDPNPELSALCIPGMVRSIMLFGPKGLDEKAVTHYITHLIERGLVRGDAAAAPKKKPARRPGKRGAQ